MNNYQESTNVYRKSFYEFVCIVPIEDIVIDSTVKSLKKVKDTFHITYELGGDVLDYKYRKFHKLHRLWDRFYYYFILNKVLGKDF